jgi:hypothetical protein
LEDPTSLSRIPKSRQENTTDSLILKGMQVALKLLRGRKIGRAMPTTTLRYLRTPPLLPWMT